MFVKYSKGTTGVVEYLKLGVSKDRDFSRDEMDIRQVLHGNIEELDIILKKYNKPNTIGDNYKHFVITFENDNTLDQDIFNITNEFKEFAKYGYKEDELYFYAEAHIPKLKGYPFMSGEYNHRKPHVHVIIPVFNLYTGNKGYNFNIGTFKYRKYLDLFTKSMNYKYNLNSPFEPENRKLFKGNSSQILRKTGREYSNKNLEIKEKILELIVNKSITNNKELMKIIKLYIPNINSIKFGDINENILILNFNNSVDHSKVIALRDYAFSQEFISLNKFKQKEIFDKYLSNKDKNIAFKNEKVYNNKLTEEGKKDLSYYQDVGAKLIKYSKIKPVIIHSIKDKSIKKQKEVLNVLEQNFYERNKYGRIKIRDNIESNLRTTDFNIKRIKSNSVTKQNLIKILSGRVRNKRGRVNSIHDINIDKSILNKALEIKFGSNPNNSFAQNYNLLSLEQKSEIYLFVAQNLKQLKEVKFLFPSVISNFYNGNLNEKLIDNYKAWLKMNKMKMSNQVLGIEPEEKWQELKDTMLIKKENKLILDEYKHKKLIIEKTYENQSKLKRKNLKELQIEYKDVIKLNEKKLTKAVRENMQINKPSLRNNTIINDTYLQFLEYCLTKKILIPKENLSDVENYVKLVEICKNKFIKNNIVVQRDIIKNNKELIMDVDKLSEEEILNKLEYEFIDGYDSFIAELEEEIEKSEKIEYSEEDIEVLDSNLEKHKEHHKTLIKKHKTDLIDIV